MMSTTIDTSKDVQEIVIVGNTGYHSKVEMKFSNFLINSARPFDFMINTGSVMSDRGVCSEEEYNYRYVQIYGTLNRTMAIVPGRFDSLAGTRLLKMRASMESNSMYMPDRFYSIDLTSTRLIFIDSIFLIQDLFWLRNEMETYWTVQKAYDWIEMKLQTMKKTIIISHLPLYDAGMNGGNEKLREGLLPLMEQYGCNVIISSGSNLMEHIKVGNIQQFIIGSTAIVDDTDPNLRNDLQPDDVKAYHKIHGFARIRIDPKSARSNTIHFYNNEHITTSIHEF